MRIATLTGGGDCPGLNAALRAIVRSATSAGDEVVGVHHGWRGLVDDEVTVLNHHNTAGILQTGGTILKTARFHPELHDGATERVQATLARHRIDAVIVIGGDGTLASSAAMARTGIAVVGIPKTIDNDVSGTQRCLGFDTAVATAADAIDRVHTTGESHDRLMVVEVMGRTTGWLAVSAGIAAGADVLCIPELPTDLDAVARRVQRRHGRGSTSSVVVVAEGAQLLDDLDHHDGQPSPATPMGAAMGAGVGTGAGAAVADGLARRTGFETRLTVLGHIQRGGSPVPSDRILASSFGVAAVDAVHAHAFGTMLAVLDDQVVPVGLDSVTVGPRPVSASLLALARQLTA